MWDSVIYNDNQSVVFQITCYLTSIYGLCREEVEKEAPWGKNDWVLLTPIANVKKIWTSLEQVTFNYPNKFSYELP